MSTRSTSVRWPILLLMLVPLAGCKRSLDEQEREQRKTEASWQATVLLTRELLSTGALTATYARQTEDAAREALDKANQKARSSQ
jgi:hypothetical protein